MTNNSLRKIRKKPSLYYNEIGAVLSYDQISWLATVKMKKLKQNFDRYYPMYT